MNLPQKESRYEYQIINKLKIMYIIKAIAEFRGQTKTLFFSNIGKTSNKESVNTFIEHWASDKNQAHQFFDKSEAEKFVLFLQKDFIKQMKILKHSSSTHKHRATKYALPNIKSTIIF